MKKLVFLIFFFLGIVACAQTEETMYYPTIHGTLADSFRIGNDVYFTISFRTDLEEVYANLNSVKKKKFVFADDSLIVNLENGLLVATTDISTLTSANSYLNGLIVALEAEMLLKTNTSAFDSLKNRTTGAEASILLNSQNITSLTQGFSILESELELKASVSTVTQIINDLGEIENRTSTAEAGIIANASGISDVNGDLQDALASLLLYALKDSLISYINISPEEIKIDTDRLNITTLTGVTFISSANGKRVIINPTTNQIEFYDTEGNYSGAISGNYYMGNAYIGALGNFSVTGDILGGQNFTNIGNFNLGGTLNIDNSNFIVSNGMITKLGGHAFPPLPSGQDYWLKWDYITGSQQQLTWDSDVATVSWVVSQGYLTELQNETDPTVYAWAKASTKPSYSYSEITGTPDLSGYASQTWVYNQGYLTEYSQLDWVNVTNRIGYNDSNWNTAYGWGNHASAGYLISESDPNVYTWAKASTKPSYTYSEVGAASSSHNHNDLYYTQTYLSGIHSNIMDALDGKSNTGHTHDERYFTESEVNTLLSGKANSSHTHGSFSTTMGFTDNDGFDHYIYITNGIITNWEVR